MKREYLAIEKWDDDYNGSGIYSLVDQDGKRYIGQSKHIQNRLHQHRQGLNQVLRNSGRGEACSGLVKAVEEGKRFKVEILKKFENSETSTDELRYWEDFYIKKYGGYDKLYNIAFVPSSNYGYENDLYAQTILVRFTATDIVEWLKGMPYENRHKYLEALVREDIHQGVSKPQ